MFFLCASHELHQHHVQIQSQYQRPYTDFKGVSVTWKCFCTFHISQKNIIKPKQPPLNTHTKLSILLIFITRQTQEPGKVAFKVFIILSLTVSPLSTVHSTWTSRLSSPGWWQNRSLIVHSDKVLILLTEPSLCVHSSVRERACL